MNTEITDKTGSKKDSESSARLDYARLGQPLPLPAPSGGLLQGMAWIAVLAPAPFWVLWAYFAAEVAGQYGWTLFVLVPFLAGATAAIIDGWFVQRTLMHSAKIGFLANGCWLIVFLAVGLDGLGCILMALPLVIPIGLFGGVVGHVIMAIGQPRRPVLWVIGMLLMSPAAMVFERTVTGRPALRSVTTCLEIDAPPQVVWNNVVAFPELPAPEGILFNSGMAYPVRARIDGRGVGATRYCEFSTGPFVEPIEVWDEPRVLKFAVTQQPLPMREWSPWGDIQPRHLHGYFTSQRGQFMLVALPGGRTRLEGTTWYRNAMAPGPYWNTWSDYILHRIHGRVLEHIKNVSEKPSGVAAGNVGEPPLSHASE